MNFQGKVILITGAGSGIGAATAEDFAKLGALLALTDRNSSGLEKTAMNCKKTNTVELLLITADLTVETDVKNLVVSVVNHFKQLDVLVNCAGIFRYSCIQNASLTVFDEIMNTNLRSIYHLTSLAVPHLIKTKGCIVNVSSLAGLKPFPRSLVYCMSKAALDQFTRNIALELAPKGVRVNGVNPGSVITNIHRNAGMSEESLEKHYSQYCKKAHPLGRAGTAEELAKSIVFLASDYSSFTTGASLLVDGGAATARN